MLTFEVTVWTNSRPNHKTGSGFGIRIPKNIRAEIFQFEWTQVLIQTNEGEFVVPITPSFWRKCSELRSRKIGKWIIDNDLSRWEKGKPPKVSVTYHGEGVFSLA